MVKLDTVYLAVINGHRKAFCTWWNEIRQECEQWLLEKTIHEIKKTNLNKRPMTHVCLYRDIEKSIIEMNGYNFPLEYKQ